MRNEKIGKFLLAFVLVIAMFSLVSAAPSVTISNPITNGNYTTTMNVSVINTLVNATANPYNVTLYCNASGGSVNARLAGDLIATIQNKSATPTIFENAAVSITSFADTLIYNCSAYADNGTAVSATFSAAVSNITIDNTAPICSMSGAGFVGLNTPQTLVYSSSDALQSVSTVVNVTGPTAYGTTTLPTANQLGGYVLGIGNSTNVGTYTATIQILDRPGNVCTATTTWKVGVVGGSVTIPNSELPGQQPNYTILLLIIAGIVVIVIASRKN